MHCRFVFGSRIAQIRGAGWAVCLKVHLREKGERPVSKVLYASKLIFPVLIVLAFSMVSVPTASADNILDFACSGTTQCNGTIGSFLGNWGITNFDSTGITLYQGAGSGPYSPTTPFQLTFNTSTGAIGLTSGSDTLSGYISSFGIFSGNSTKDLMLTANWTNLTPAAQAFLDSTIGADSGFLIYLSNSGAVSSADITITAPEPGSLLLLGTGLFALGALIKRKVNLS